MQGEASRVAARVSQDRVWSWLMDLARFGGGDNGAVTRFALSAEEAQARAHLVTLGATLGLTAHTDCAGNLFLRMEGSAPDLPPVLTGSHIDSQPNGGRFDGAAGVLAGLEALAAIRDAGLRPHRPIEVVAWTNEEASRFAPGMTGSRVYTGALAIEEARRIKDADGITFGEAVDRILAGDHGVTQRPVGRPCHAFIELHIEQGPELERLGIPLAIVSGMQGTRRYRVNVEGDAAHAGTALRAERRDALLAAVRMIAAMDRAASEPADLKFTVGHLTLTPNAPSVVPQRAYFSIDIRHPDNGVIDRLDRQIREIVAREAAPCDVRLDQIAHAPSLDFPRPIRGLLQEAARALDLPAVDLYSAAGHDSRELHYFCPTGMIFIPCRGGISHNPAEWTEPEHVAAGARLLAAALWRLSLDH